MGIFEVFVCYSVLPVVCIVLGGVLLACGVDGPQVMVVACAMCEALVVLVFGLIGVVSRHSRG